MKNTTFTIVILFLVLATLPSYAGDSNFKKYIGDTENVTAQGETEKYYWVGTNHGVYYIRKKNGNVYHMTTKNSVLPSDSITGLAVKENGEVYISTHNGIVRYDKYTFLLINTENSPLESNNITTLAIVKGDVYAGTAGGGITLFSDSKSKTYTSKNTVLQNNHILSFERKGDDNLIAVVEGGSRVGIRNAQFTVLNSEK